MSFVETEAAIFAAGDRVKLKPARSDEDDVQAYLNYDQVYTVRAVAHSRALGHQPPDSYVTLEEDSSKTKWLARRFELVEDEPALPHRGDEVEVVIRARVAAVQEIHGTHIIYFEEVDGRHIAPAYLYGVTSITVLTPAKPRLDLDALPNGTVIEGLNGDTTMGIYRKTVNGGKWAALNGRRYSSAELYAEHTQIVELVRKEETP
jgi:hypothetical protein